MKGVNSQSASFHATPNALSWWIEKQPLLYTDEAAGRPHGAARRRPRPVKVDT